MDSSSTRASAGRRFRHSLETSGGCWVLVAGSSVAATLALVARFAFPA